jgi:hypothetical protein
VPPSTCAQTNAGLGCAVGGVTRNALERGDGRNQDDCAAITDERKRLLDRKEKSAHVGAEGLVEILFRRVDERLRIDEARVCNKDIDLSLLFPDSFIEPIEIVEVLHVSSIGRNAISKESGGHVELVPPATGDVDEGAFVHKPLRRCEPEAAATTRETATLPCNLGISLLLVIRPAQEL